MYGIPPPNQHYQQSPYGYTNPVPQPHPPPPSSTSTQSLQALSQAALGHSNNHHQPRIIQPAPPPQTEELARGGQSVSPKEEEDDSTMNGTAKGTTATTTKGKQARKRGRKRIEEDPAEIEANDALDADAKRKLQNRAAQRAFRERKERRTVELEEKVVQQEAELAQCREIINQLRRENEALRRGENPPQTQALASNGTSASPPDVKPVPSSNAASPSFHHNILHESNGPLPLRPRFESTTSNSPPLPPQPIAETFPSPPVQQQAMTPVVTGVSPNFENLDLSKFDTSFDFDAPFDFSESMALPPLFASLLDDLSLPPSTNTDVDSNRATYADQPTSIEHSSTSQPHMHLDPTSSHSHSQKPPPPSSEDPEPDLNSDDDPPLPLGRIPCDKPECDFTAVSCALPIPWRPPNAPKGAGDKDLWIAQKCWAKLVSHPLFDRCDPDELCQELRDKTRCSDDGRLVCHKNDVCEIFRSIPQKAKTRLLTHG
ncbi:bZIP transcription factor [Sporobolomyces salmoneus]|uniref:bZIP transcription factor n=1 Tax=Sporobolomyces salmoneus TaxID=183962 RepID=UPI0031741035